MYRGTGKNKFILGYVAELVHGLALLCLRFLYALAFVAYDHIWPPIKQGLKDALSPGALVVYYCYKKRFKRKGRQASKRCQAFLLIPQKDRYVVFKVRVLVKLFRPNAADRSRRDYKYRLNGSHLVGCAHRGYGCKRLSASHLEKEAEAFTFCHKRSLRPVSKFISASAKSAAF